MLKHYLKRVGKVTGPLSRNTSHSALEVIKKDLLGLPQFKGGEHFLIFGNDLHEHYLEDKYPRKVNAAERNKIMVMVSKLRAHPIAHQLYKESTREKKCYIKIQGVEISFILDILQPIFKRGADLKSTSCSNEKEFIEKAKEYGYFRQGETYKQAAKLKSFFFIGIQKQSPYNIYILNVDDYKEEMRYAKEELKFLLYFYKHYGKTINTESG